MKSKKIKKLNRRSFGLVKVAWFYVTVIDERILGNGEKSVTPAGELKGKGSMGSKISIGQR